jgi:hypothetical protein
MFGLRTAANQFFSSVDISTRIILHESVEEADKVLRHASKGVSGSWAERRLRRDDRRNTLAEARPRLPGTGGITTGTNLTKRLLMLISA